MTGSDVLVRTLQGSVDSLRELIEYIEAREGFDRADADYCRHKARAVVRQLATWTRFAGQCRKLDSEFEPGLWRAL